MNMPSGWVKSEQQARERDLAAVRQFARAKSECAGMPQRYQDSVWRKHRFLQRGGNPAHLSNRGSAGIEPVSERKPQCPACRVEVVVTKELPLPYKRCLGPGEGMEYPLNRILKTIEEDRKRRAAPRESSGFLG